MADTLEELWISYNNIEKLKGIGVLKKLKVICIDEFLLLAKIFNFSNSFTFGSQVLYMSNNQVKAWEEFQKLVLNFSHTY